MRPVPGLRLDQIDPGWGANVPAHWCTRLHGQRGPYMEKALGGSPLLQQGELDFSPAEKQSILKWALALGFSLPALKRVIKADLFRSAEALLPPHKCGGSHREDTPGFTSCPTATVWEQNLRRRCWLVFSYLLLSYSIYMVLLLLLLCFCNDFRGVSY